MLPQHIMVHIHYQHIHYYSIFTIKVLLPQSNQAIHQIQTDDIDIEFPKIFTEHLKYLQITLLQSPNPSYNKAPRTPPSFFLVSALTKLRKNLTY